MGRKNDIEFFNLQNKYKNCLAYKISAIEKTVSLESRIAYTNIWLRGNDVTTGQGILDSRSNPRLPHTQPIQ